MKHLILVIHHNLKQDAADLFHSIEQVQGFTFSNVEGYSRHAEKGSTDRDKVEGYTPHVRVDIFLQDNDVASVLEKIRESSIALNKHITYWITSVAEYGRL